MKAHARYRVRHIEVPWHFARQSFGTVHSGKALITIGCPKGHFHAGRCAVGTRAVRILIPKSRR